MSLATISFPVSTKRTLFSGLNVIGITTRTPYLATFRLLLFGTIWILHWCGRLDSNQRPSGCSRSDALTPLSYVRIEIPTLPVA